MIEITTKRLKSLERSESKLNALEAGGVDNWDWYDESLKGYYKDNEIEEEREMLFDDLEIAFGEAAYEPSEHGAGVAFRDDVHDEIFEIFNRFGVIFKDKEHEIS